MISRGLILSLQVGRATRHAGSWLRVVRRVLKALPGGAHEPLLVGLNCCAIGLSDHYYCRQPAGDQGAESTAVGDVRSSAFRCSFVNFSFRSFYEAWYQKRLHQRDSRATMRSLRFLGTNRNQQHSPGPKKSNAQSDRPLPVRPREIELTIFKDTRTAIGGA
jgi:hypothetical protein